MMDDPRDASEDSSTFPEEAAEQASGSGYSSDIEETEDPETDDLSLLMTPGAPMARDTDAVYRGGDGVKECRKRCFPLDRTSSESSSLSSTSSDSLTWKYKYLHEKCRLLQQASNALHREDVYAASIALQQTVPPTSNLWEEARVLLGELLMCEDARKEKDAALRPPKRVRIMEPPQPWRRGRREVGIDLSLVHHLRSQGMDESTKKFLLPSWLCRKTSMEEEDGQHPDDQDDNNCSNDTRTTTSKPTEEIPSTFIVNPQLVPTGTMDMDKALALTSTAQLLVQAIPPFATVHANRAFYELSGLSHEWAVGRPIEQVVVQPHCTNRGNARMEGKTGMAVHVRDSTQEDNTNNDKPYDMRVFSVRDAPKGGAPLSSSYSHVLVQLFPWSSSGGQARPMHQELTVAAGHCGVLLGIG